MVKAPAPLPWWNAAVHAGRRPRLLARGQIQAALRAWFIARGFVEVDCSCLQASPGNETHLHAFATELVGTDLSRTPLYLHTSPEFAMKKLLAAGESRIFTFAPVFRNRERGALHAPSFTMLEWYRAGAEMPELWDDCAAILRIAAETTGHRAWSFRNRHCDPVAPPAQLAVLDAFRSKADIDLAATFTASATDRDALARRAAAAGVRCASDDTWSDIFSRVTVEKLEPALGSPRTTVLHAYPIHEAALARPLPADPRLAERFEIYCCGVELANGFGELVDPIEQRRRLQQQMAERERIYGERYPIDEDFLAALADMPPAAGCALGFDRLVMLATGARHIDQVQWTPAPPSA
ncbi:MAG: EF-P lysine aminoacylase EpmA [Hyphomicrobiaceae bacterium]